MPSVISADGPRNTAVDWLADTPLGGTRDSRSKRVDMKLILELVLSAVLHPVAVILMWINLAGRTDLSRWKKILWALLGLVWGIGPILYILVGDGILW
jgi:hypothetical protein